MSGAFKDKVMSAFGERLTRAREAAGYTHAETFANTLGISGATYRYWERGQASPSIDMLTRICLALNIEANELLPMTVVKPEEQKATKSRRSAKKKKVAVHPTRNGGQPNG